MEKENKKKLKRILKIVLSPIGFIFLVLFFIYLLIGNVFQLFIGVYSYLCNWKEDRKLKEEIKSAEFIDI